MIIRNLKHLVLLLLLMASMPVSGFNTDSLCRPVDEAIRHAADYVANYERQITQARYAYDIETDAEEKYERSFKLYQLYRPFVNDSAMYFLQRCIELARKSGDVSGEVKSRSLLGNRCANAGMYDEALLILDSIQTSGADKTALCAYYEAYNYVYNELAYYTRMERMKQIYLEKAAHYEKLMFDYLPADAETRFLRLEQKAQAEGNFEASMRINDAWLQTVQHGSHPYAMTALYRYIEYKFQRDTTQMMHWLVESVLADIRNSAMDQGSMWELANELMLQGDMDRASRYINFTSDCANRYGSRQRNWQISPLLSDIAKNYKEQSDRTTSQLRLTLLLISVMFLLLLVAMFFVHRRNRQLYAAREAQRQANSELASANTQLSALNGQLSTLNTRLSSVNTQLSEANRVKEEYIGRFMSLCSQYIDKMDNYRKMVNRMMKNKEFDELYRISKSDELKERELEELYENFDSVFLHLFPNFIDDLNQMLSPEVQVHPKEENRLTTDLRIFALIRLGIEDSSKIAEFLHYSVNTIYNYRARIKNGALDNREQFEQRVKELGR